MSIVVRLNSVNEYCKSKCQILTSASLNLNETFVKQNMFTLKGIL
jgi:hypothetical protein